MQRKFEKLLSFSILNKATDIHIDLIDDSIKFSIRGFEGFIAYTHGTKELLEYIKYISNLNLINYNEPQTGSFKYLFNDDQYYFRVASIKTTFMESCVIRILNKFYLEGEFSLDSEINSEFLKLLNYDNGLILFSGPTGSGKTTSMYKLINRFHNKKIFTIEDPIEIYFDGIIQTEVNHAIGFDYATAIKQLLRHDPDVIVVGEIRDEEAAQMAVRAALTGHLVICTIHSNSPQQAIYRLEELNVNPHFLKDALKFVSNQRLKHANNERYVEYTLGQF